MELDAILGAPKNIVEDIDWSPDEDHSPTVEFRVNVDFEGRAGLSVRGTYNALAQKLSFLFLYQGTGRIYALDMGVDHHNIDCHNVGEVHKHKWTDGQGAKFAYVPIDITEPATNPHGVWEQFCRESNIVHFGTLGPIPAAQLDLFL
jgi:hypothetical protein